MKPECAAYTGVPGLAHSCRPWSPCVPNTVTRLMVEGTIGHTNGLPLHTSPGSGFGRGRGAAWGVTCGAEAAALAGLGGVARPPEGPLVANTIASSSCFGGAQKKEKGV